MNLAALVQGVPFMGCPCLTDRSVHYHAEPAFVMTLSSAEEWRMRPLRLLSPRLVTWSAAGGDDPDWSSATDYH
jgi:hypothetical protein